MLKERNIVFFDAKCLLCQSSVQFILRKEKDGRIFFSANDSQTANQVGLKEEDAKKSLYYYRNGKMLQESDAILYLAKDMGGINRLWSVLLLIPRRLRNVLYRMISKRRTKWFGEAEPCMILNKEQEHRFLE